MKKKYIELVAKKHLGMMDWIQEFSKKIVAVTFVIFVVVHIYILAMMTVKYLMSGDLEDMTNLLSETHLTFREVIGGYIIKAAAENVLKVSGGILEKYLGIKYANKEQEEDLNEEEIYSDTRGNDC